MARGSKLGSSSAQLRCKGNATLPSFAPPSRGPITRALFPCLDVFTRLEGSSLPALIVRHPCPNCLLRNKQLLSALCTKGRSHCAQGYVGGMDPASGVLFAAWLFWMEPSPHSGFVPWTFAQMLLEGKSQEIWVQFLARLLLHWVTLGKSFSLSMPRFPLTI